MNVIIKKLDPDAHIPTYASEGAACFDLYANESGYSRVGFRRIVRTGISVQVPEGHVLMLFSRSGHAYKHSIRLSNCVGIIDSDYRGEILVMLHNDGSFDFEFLKGDRIAQGMIVPVPRINLVEGELTETERGSGGFGSTGK